MNDLSSTDLKNIGFRFTIYEYQNKRRVSARLESKEQKTESYLGDYKAQSDEEAIFEGEQWARGLVNKLMEQNLFQQWRRIPKNKK